MSASWHLAPRPGMKRDLYFSKPLMNAAGSLGFAPDTRAEISWDSFGAFITNPISLRPRQPTGKPELIEYPGGFLLHSGLPNPGFHASLKKHSSRWNKSELPVIVHLMADRPAETQHMVRALEMQDNVLAAELGFAPLLAEDILLLTLEMCLGELPLIFSLPVEQVLSLGPRLVQQGAQAISLSAPRGALPPLPSPRADRRGRTSLRSASGDEAPQGKPITGRLYGPSLFPRTLETVYSAAKIGLPVIGAGGIWSKEHLAAMLAAGALAVQIDAAFWNPATSFSAPTT